MIQQDSLQHLDDMLLDLHNEYKINKNIDSDYFRKNKKDEPIINSIKMHKLDFDNIPNFNKLKANQIRFTLLNNDHHGYKKSKLLPYSATTLLKQMFNVSFKKNSSLEAGRRAGWIMYKLLDNNIDLTNEEFLKWKNNKPLESMYQSFINKI